MTQFSANGTPQSIPLDFSLTVCTDEDCALQQLKLALLVIAGTGHRNHFQIVKEIFRALPELRYA